MHFSFSGKSKLHGRRVFQPIDRISYVPQSEEGKQEYIFAYNGPIPTPLEEPDLFRDARVLSTNDDEATLEYPGLDEVVLLLTLDADDAFREDNPEVVAQNELFKIE